MRKKQGGLAKLFFCFGPGLLLAGAAAAAQGPMFSDSGPYASEYGAAEHFPVGSQSTLNEQKYMVGAFSHFDLLFPVHNVAAADRPWQFQRPSASPDIGYMHAGNHFKLQEYLAHLPITGLLIAKDDQILFEGYQYGRTGRDRLTSQSMAKTMVAMLVGQALSENAIAAITDPAGKYVPELKNSAYGKIAVRDLLHMSSGVSCQAAQSSSEEIPLRSLARDCQQEAPAGTRFQYSASDAQVLGLILNRAVKMPLASYLDQKIWKDIGTEANAAWVVDSSGQETAYCCFNAVLRDYARFARLLAFDGEWNGKQLIPRQWIVDASTVKDTDPQLVPGKSTRFFGYGYQAWIFPGPRRMFGLIGANGQRIFVDPQSKLIMVQTAVMEKGMDPPKDAEMIGLWLSLVHRFGND